VINKCFGDVLSFAKISTKSKIFSMLALVALADFLFYDYDIGWVLGFFGCLLVGAFSLHNSALLKSRMAVVIVLFTLGQCFLLFEKSSDLSFVLMILGLVSLSLLRRDDWKKDAGQWGRLCFFSLLRFMGPLNRLSRGYKRYVYKHPSQNILQTFFRGWFLPIFLSLVFLYLFARANPIMMDWLDNIDIKILFSVLSFWRVVFWVIVASLVVLVIRPRLKLSGCKNKGSVSVKSNDIRDFARWVFTKDAVLRSLVIFNLMFALQTFMDVNYLWAEGALPEGVSYAQYAHKGAYPLIVTALLAALFALVTQSAKEEISGSKIISGLMYLWIGQNVFLVFSAIYRTSLYVEIYALTYMRVAAFIWMGLVACGLIWIILRGALGKSNRWLINANVLTLLTVLYITSFVNVGGVIAHYNVAHSKEVSGKGVALDVTYLREMGTVAIPALQKYDAQAGTQWSAPFQQRLKRNMVDWRHWTYSKHRLLKSLEGS